VELAERLGHTDIRAYALWTTDQTERALELAREEGLEDLVADLLLRLAAIALSQRSYDTGFRYLEVGIDHCVRHGNDLLLRYFLAEQARAQLDRGQWDAAAESAAQVLRLRAVSTFPRITSLVVLALVRARRGDPDAEPLLLEAFELAEASGELLRSWRGWRGNSTRSRLRRAPRSSSRSSGRRAGSQASCSAGVAAPGSPIGPFQTFPSRTGSSSTATGSRPPPAGRDWAAPTTRRWRWRRQTTRTRCAAPTTSSSASAPALRRRSSPAAYASAARVTSPAAPGRRHTPIQGS
jgi:hypothetical protein